MIRRTRVIPFADPLLFNPESLKGPEHITIRRRYEEHGGDFKFLCFLAAQARPELSPLSRNQRVLLTRMEAELQRLLRRPDQDDGQKRELSRQLFAVRVYLRPFPVRQDPPANPARRTGRPRGTTRPTLAAATLAYEFRRWFRSPCYPYVLAMLQKVAPQEFPQTYDLKALQNRIAEVPPDEYVQFHADVTRAWSAR